MDASRIVIGLADDSANELARHQKNDTASIEDITTACAGGVGLAHGTAIAQRRPAPRAGFDEQPYLTAAGINLPAMRRGADAARWARYDGAGVQFIQIEEGWNVRHNAFNHRVRKESPGTDFTIGQMLHGNAGLGIVLANGAASRIRGIAPACTLKGLYALKYAAGRPHERLEKAIGLAAKSMLVKVTLSAPPGAPAGDQFPPEDHEGSPAAPLQKVGAAETELASATTVATRMPLTTWGALFI